MVKWEYKIITLQLRHLDKEKEKQEWEKALNKLGKEGWELVKVVYVQKLRMPDAFKCFLKRKRK